MLPPIKEHRICHTIKPTLSPETATVDDDAAKTRAEQLTDFSDVELWEHARRVAKFGTKSD